MLKKRNIQISTKTLSNKIIKYLDVDSNISDKKDKTKQMNKFTLIVVLQSEWKKLKKKKKGYWTYHVKAKTKNNKKNKKQKQKQKKRKIISS